MDKKNPVKSLQEGHSLSSGKRHMSQFYSNCGHSMFSLCLINNFIKHFFNAHAEITVAIPQFLLGDLTFLKVQIL